VGEGQTVPIQTIVGVIDAAGLSGFGSSAGSGESGCSRSPCCKGSRRRCSSTSSAEACGSGGRTCTCFLGFNGRADSQFAAGTAHGQGARHRPLHRGGYGRGWANQQTGHRGRDCGRWRTVCRGGGFTPLRLRRRLRDRRHRQPRRECPAGRRTWRSKPQSRARRCTSAITKCSR